MYWNNFGDHLASNEMFLAEAPYCTARMAVSLSGHEQLVQGAAAVIPRSNCDQLIWTSGRSCIPCLPFIDPLQFRLALDLRI